MGVNNNIIKWKEDDFVYLLVIEIMLFKKYDNLNESINMFIFVINYCKIIKVFK